MTAYILIIIVVILSHKQKATFQAHGSTNLLHLCVIALQMGWAAPMTQPSNNPLPTCTQPPRCKCPGTMCLATMTTAMGLLPEMPRPVIAPLLTRAATSALCIRSDPRRLSRLRARYMERLLKTYCLPAGFGTFFCGDLTCNISSMS